MQLCVFEDELVPHLHPLTATRAVYDLRAAHHTVLDRICRAFDPSSLTLHTRQDLRRVTEARHPEADIGGQVESSHGALFVNGRYLAIDRDQVEQIRETCRADAPATCFVQDGTTVAAWKPIGQAISLKPSALGRSTFADFREQETPRARLIDRMWEFIDVLPDLLRVEGQRVLDQHAPDPPPDSGSGGTVAIRAEHKVYCERSAVIKPGAILNAEYGPIVIGEEAVIKEGAIVRGPAYVGTRSEIEPAGRIRSTAIGPNVRVGGEVESSIIHSFSNKVHDGFLGSSYIGRWCNIAADANTSTMRNDYGTHTLYNSALDRFEQTGQEYLGLFMGDHSKCGINTMFNPGSTVGVFCNVFGSGYMPRQIPDFSWGGEDEFVPYRLEKALEVAHAMMSRRNRSPGDAEQELIRQIFARTHGQTS